MARKLLISDWNPGQAEFRPRMPVNVQVPGPRWDSDLVASSATWDNQAVQQASLFWKLVPKRPSTPAAEQIPLVSFESITDACAPDHSSDLTALRWGPES